MEGRVFVLISYVYVFVIGGPSPQTQLSGSCPLSDLVPENQVLRKIRSVLDEVLAPMLRAYESSYA